MLVEALLLRRYKRFLCDVRLPGGEEVVAWCPNPGSMATIPTESVPCRVSPAPPGRKLGWTLEQIRVGPTWVMAHPTRANAVVGEALAKGAIGDLTSDEIRPEVRYGEGSRVDFRLGGVRPTWVEVKNVTMAEGGVGLFPDAVSVRSTKHLHDLIRVVAQGDRGVLLFHVGRGDVRLVRPAAAVDPVYAKALSLAVASGVEVMAFRCDVGAHDLVLSAPLPVEVH